MTQTEELENAYAKLAQQKKEIEARAEELVIANNELLFQNAEKQKRAEELTTACRELQTAESSLKRYISALEEVLFINSHKVRGPVSNIMALLNEVEHFTQSPEKLQEFVQYLKESSLSLDAYTRELSSFISNLKDQGTRV